MDLIITFAILLFSAIVHEVSHGLMAEYLGDPTARQEGRITLNPISHIDPFGSIILPALLYFGSAGFAPSQRVVFGYAKPVPVDMYRLTRFKSRQWGFALVSFAGPFSNLVLAVFFALLIKIGLVNEISAPILVSAIVINLSLAIFNLIPIPPLDGSKILLAFLPYESWYVKALQFERFGFILIYVFISSGIMDRILWPVVDAFFRFFGLG